MSVCQCPACGYWGEPQLAPACPQCGMILELSPAPLASQPPIYEHTDEDQQAIAALLESLSQRNVLQMPPDLAFFARALPPVCTDQHPDQPVASNTMEWTQHTPAKE